jgi:hypothetical protein
MQTLNKIRGRVSFWGVYQAIDQLECEKIQNKHLTEAQSKLVSKRD